MTTLAELHANLTKMRDLRRFNKLLFWEPYPRQSEFAALSSSCSEIALCAGNQVGKTDVGAAVMAGHLTGSYPDWYAGRKFDVAVTAWAGGPNAIQAHFGFSPNPALAFVRPKKGASRCGKYRKQPRGILTFAAPGRPMRRPSGQILRIGRRCSPPGA